MAKLSKKEVITTIQFFLTMSMMSFGFWFIYLLMWINFGLPTEWWSACITAVLALLSMWGLCQWIYKSGVKYGK